jgi:hypothetical protein
MKKPAFVSPHGKPGFYFDEEDMKQLLKLYYFGESGRWRSHLDRLDHTDRLQKDRGIVLDPGAIRYGNPLLKQFSHPQMDGVIRQLAEKTVWRAGQGVTGWYEYVLRCWAGRTSPDLHANLRMPEVRDKDTLRALVQLSNLLAQRLGQIDAGSGHPSEPAFNTVHAQAEKDARIAALLKRMMGKD